MQRPRHLETQKGHRRATSTSSRSAERAKACNFRVISKRRKGKGAQLPRHLETQKGQRRATSAVPQNPERAKACNVAAARNAERVKAFNFRRNLETQKRGTSKRRCSSRSRATSAARRKGKASGFFPRTRKLRLAQLPIATPSRRKGKGSRATSARENARCRLLSPPGH